MCNTYNTIGSLTTVKTHLYNHNIHEFGSLKEVIDFQSSYAIKRQDIIDHHTHLIELEIDALQNEISKLDITINEMKPDASDEVRMDIENELSKFHFNPVKTSENLLRKSFKLIKTGISEIQFQFKKFKNYSKADAQIRSAIQNLKVKYGRFQYLDSNFEQAVNDSSRTTLGELERKQNIIKEISPSLLGALGEQKVVKELEQLPDDHYLINDFCLSFTPGIYFQKENNYIKSIQIDHLLVAPSGIFLIETKNWSQESLNNFDLRSPVNQIKRSSYALFKLLNEDSVADKLNLTSHHWGNRKISIKNLLVFINSKPKEEFQFVKIVTLKDLLGYINYFKPVLSSEETLEVAEYLLELNNHKIVDKKTRYKRGFWNSIFR